MRNESIKISKTDLCDETIMLNMEAQLSQLVAPQRELLAGGTGGHRLEPRRYLGHVVGFPVLRVDNNTFTLKN